MRLDARAAACDRGVTTKQATPRRTVSAVKIVWGLILSVRPSSTVSLTPHILGRPSKSRRQIDVESGIAHRVSAWIAGVAWTAHRAILSTSRTFRRPCGTTGAQIGCTTSHHAPIRAALPAVTVRWWLGLGASRSPESGPRGSRRVRGYGRSRHRWSGKASWLGSSPCAGRRTSR
jgi:hypothetical protein